MLPLRIFTSQKPQNDREVYLFTRARNALAKAIKVQPRVKRLIWLERDPARRRYYLAYQKRADAREHLVQLFCDRDGEWFVSCNCPANNPPADPSSGIIKWQPGPCYAMAAVLLHYTRAGAIADD